MVGSISIHGTLGHLIFSMPKILHITFTHSFLHKNFHNMKNLFFLIFCILFSCEKQQNSSILIDTEIDIIIENESGDNLILAQTPDFIVFDSIKIAYLLNGGQFNVYNSNMDCPRSICLINDPGYAVRVRIFPNDVIDAEYPITYINWGNGDIDTLKCHFLRKNEGAYVSCDKVWFNEVQMFPDQVIPDLGRAFKIVK